MVARGLVKEGPAPQEWEGFSFSNITLRNFTLQKNRSRPFGSASFTQKEDYLSVILSS